MIALASESDAHLLLIDELIGRRFAVNADLSVTGTIGILIKAKKLGLIG